mgnify:CR=1 FL=1
METTNEVETYGPGHGVAHALRRLEQTLWHAEQDLRCATGAWGGAIAPLGVQEEVNARIAGIKLAIKAVERIHVGENQ